MGQCSAVQWECLPRCCSDGSDGEGDLAFGGEGSVEQRVPEPHPSDRRGQDQTRECVCRY